jgi:hypothetical protein
MNLHGIAAPLIGVVNPFIPVTIKISTGYSTDSDGTRVPSYTFLYDVPAQIQALSFGDLRQLDGLELNGEKRKIYLNGQFDSVNRPRGTGGDLITFPDGNVWPYGTVWLVVQALEVWPDWVSLAVTMQNNA